MILRPPPVFAVRINEKDPHTVSVGEVTDSIGRIGADDIYPMFQGHASGPVSPAVARCRIRPITVVDFNHDAKDRGSPLRFPCHDHLFVRNGTPLVGATYDEDWSYDRESKDRPRTIESACGGSIKASVFPYRQARTREGSIRAVV